jgi:hypothetical protein
MAKSCLYSYEEFSDHLKAMKTVRQWEDTSRFGHVGADQSSRANNARVLEYFCDSYADPQEAVKKADIFLSIHDYIGRNVAPLSRKNFIDMLENNLLSIDPALLRAVHYVFTAGQEPATTDPKTVLSLAQTFQKI